MATRTVGSGSADARMQALMRLLARLPLYSEAGRERILEDLTSADVGHSLMRRYIPKTKSSASIEFQRGQAQDKVALLRLNIIPLVTADQNPLIYAETFLQAAAEALAGLQRGIGNPVEVSAFVDNCGQAVAMHLDRIKGDSTRKQAYDALMEQLNKLGAANDQLKQAIQKQMQQNGKQQQKTQRAMSDEEINQFKALQDAERKNRKAQVDSAAKIEKTRFGNRLKAETARQTMAIKDVQTAQDLRHQQLEHEASDDSNSG